MSEFSKLGVGGVDPTVNPKYYNDLDNELMLSTQATPSTLDLNKLEAADLNNIQSLLDASTSYLRKSFVPNNMPDNLGGMSTNQYPTEGILGIDVGQDDPAFENDLMAKVTQDDIDRSKSRTFKSMDYDTYKMIVPNTQVTPYEFEQLKKGNITEPGTYTV